MLSVEDQADLDAWHQMFREPKAKEPKIAESVYAHVLRLMKRILKNHA
jgi:hypothetical protein